MPDASPPNQKMLQRYAACTVTPRQPFRRFNWYSPACTRRSALAHPDFIDMAQQVPGILVDAVGPRSLEFLLPVAARQQSDPERASTTRGKQIPDAVADNHSIADLGA